MLFSLVKRLVGRGVSTPRRKGRVGKSRPRNTVRLGVEGLEDRCVPATFTVVDLKNAAIGNLATNTGTLRWCIEQANASTDPASTINFKTSLTGTIKLESQLDLKKNITINGPGADVITVQRDATKGPFRIFLNLPSSNSSIVGLTVKNGEAGPVRPEGGAIDNYGTLAVTSCNLYDNEARDGGAIFNHADATMSIWDCSVAGNKATTNGVGGGIWNDGRMTISDTSIYANTAVNDGGGIFNDNKGNLTVFDTSVLANGAGGAITNTGSFGMSGGEIDFNTAVIAGGGLYQRNTHFSTKDANSVLFGVDIESNQIDTTNGLYGGGVWVQRGKMTLDTCTIQGNQEPQGAGGAAFLKDDAKLTVINCVGTDLPIVAIKL